LSILTKILIVLLTFFSLFLCGMVVTYVGSADNYRAKLDDAEVEISALQAHLAYLTQLAQEKTMLAEETIEANSSKIQQLEASSTELMVNLKTSQYESLGHQNRADRWQGQLESCNQTIANQRQMLENTQAQLDEIRRRSIKDQKELAQVTASLYEKILQMQSLEADKRRELEKLALMENEVKEVIGRDGRVASVQPVTREKSAVTVARAPSGVVDLKARISEIQENLATISIGLADGVKKDMVFHVTRGDGFICDIVITHVDTDKAAGILELKVQQPKVGDNVSTILM